MRPGSSPQHLARLLGRRHRGLTACPTPPEPRGSPGPPHPLYPAHPTSYTSFSWRLHTPLRSPRSRSPSLNHPQLRLTHGMCSSTEHSHPFRSAHPSLSYPIAPNRPILFPIRNPAICPPLLPTAHRFIVNRMIDLTFLVDMILQVLRPSKHLLSQPLPTLVHLAHPRRPTPRRPAPLIPPIPVPPRSSRGQFFIIYQVRGHSRVTIWEENRLKIRRHYFATWWAGHGVYPVCHLAPAELSRWRLIMAGYR